MPCITRKEEVSANVAPGWFSAHGGAWGSTQWLGTARGRWSELLEVHQSWGYIRWPSWPSQFECRAKC